MSRRGRGALPTFLIIGASKCGTTSLHYYVGLHPEISVSRLKETNFFTVDGAWSRGTEWYRSQFDPRAPARGEASPDYTNFPRHAGVPERIRSVLPDVRLIYLVRDPVERALASYSHNFADGRETRPLREAFRDFDASQYVQSSRFAMQLELYLELFDASQILVLSTDELRAERERTLRRVFRFVDVDESFSSPEFRREKNTGAQKRKKTALGLLVERSAFRVLGRERVLPAIARIPPGVLRPLTRAHSRPSLPEDLHAALREHFEPDVRRLRELTGVELPGWPR